MKYIITILALIIVGVAGWGFYQGYKVKSYAKEVKSIMDQSTGKWTYNQIIIKGYNNKSEMEADLKLVYSDSKEQLVKLNTLKPTSKTHDLEQRTQSYFSTAILAADQAQVILDSNAFIDIISTPLVAAEQEIILQTYPDQIKSEAANLQKTLFTLRS